MITLLPELTFNSSYAGRQTAVQRTRAHAVWLRTALLFVVSMLAGATAIFAQALPAAVASPPSTGFALPSIQGSLRYGIGANESVSTGYYGSGTAVQTGFNGNVAYLSSSQLDPFSLVFSGGDELGNQSGVASTYYLNLGISQVINTRHWNFVLTDAVGYLPQTPSVGLSGVPGTGDVGLAPISGGDTGQGILTNYSARVSNTASLGAGLHLTAKTDLQFSGSYGVLDFVPQSPGDFNSTNSAGSVGLSHRIDARNTLSANYGYTEYDYGPNQPRIESQTASGQYSHEFTRQFSMSLSAGPQWSSYSNISPAQPTKINAFVAASATYAGRYTTYGLSYTRSNNTGSGVVLGARSDSVNLRVSRTFARVWNASASGSYSHTTALQTSVIQQGFAPQTEVGAVQLARALGHSLSFYGSYTLENQGNLGAAPGSNVFSGLYQVGSFGLTFSPNPIHLGPR